MGSRDEGCHLCITWLEGDTLGCGDFTAVQNPVTVRGAGVDPDRLGSDSDCRGCTSSPVQLFRTRNALSLMNCRGSAPLGELVVVWEETYHMVEVIR